jgi:aspartate-semialdehyde dehydrogenase
MANKKPHPRIGVVGATGLVGRILLDVLSERRFPVGELKPFSSGRSASAVSWRGRRIPCRAASLDALAHCDLVFLVSSDEVSELYGRALAERGVWVIDDSSAFRLHKDVPLVIPEVNVGALSPRSRLIAGPNCTLTGAAVVGAPLVRAGGMRAVRIASYQAVSGAGRAALEEYHTQARRAAVRAGRRGPLDIPSYPVPRVFPKPIALNLFPQVGSFDENGDSSEEFKVREELRKIWGMPTLPISATTVRVPIIRCHSLALWIETIRPLALPRVRTLLRRAPGLRLWEHDYPTPATVVGTDGVHVGRVRMGALRNELSFWVVSDNLRKGAALNSVQIAECILKKRWI